MLVAAQFWTHWMAVGLVLLVIPATIATVIGYFRSVVRVKYPPRGSRPS